VALGLSAPDALIAPRENINTVTAALALGAAHVRSVQVVPTHPHVSMSMDTAADAFGVALAHTVQVVRTHPHVSMSTDMKNTVFDAQKFEPRSVGEVCISKGASVRSYTGELEEVRKIAKEIHGDDFFDDEDKE
jgi:hypothetical protein